MCDPSAHQWVSFMRAASLRAARPGGVRDSVPDSNPLSGTSLVAVSPLRFSEPSPLGELLVDVKSLRREERDWAPPDALMRKAYASLYLNMVKALNWARTALLNPNVGAKVAHGSGTQSRPMGVAGRKPAIPRTRVP